jgi:coatomer subunit beta
LDRFKSLKNTYGKLLDDFAIDTLRVLASPDLDVRKKAVSIMLEMVSRKNVSDIVSFLKKEVLKARDQEQEKSHEYKQLLIQSIHACAIKFSDLVASVASTLLEFVNDKNVAVGVDVVHFIR